MGARAGAIAPQCSRGGPRAGLSLKVEMKVRGRERWVLSKRGKGKGAGDRGKALLVRRGRESVDMSETSQKRLLFEDDS